MDECVYITNVLSKSSPAGVVIGQYDGLIWTEQNFTFVKRIQ